MATYTVAPTERGAYEKTLVASTVDTVTFTASSGSGWRSPQKVEVINEGDAGIYGTHNNVNPTVGGASCWYVPASSRAVVDVKDANLEDDMIVKLISSGTPKYSVARVS